VSSSRYAAALSVHPVAFEAVGAVAGELLEQLDGERPDLVVCFVSRHHVDAFADIASGLRAILEPDVLVGVTAVAVAGGAREIEDEQVRRDVRREFGGAGREERAGDVDARRRPFDLTELHVLHEQRRHDLHDGEARPPPRASVRFSSP